MKVWAYRLRPSKNTVNIGSPLSLEHANESMSVQLWTRDPTLIAPPPANVNRFSLPTYQLFKSQVTETIDTGDSETYRNHNASRISFGFCNHEKSENIFD